MSHTIPPTRPPTSRPDLATAATALVVIAVGLLTYFLLRHQPFFHDANGYALAGRSLTDKGLLGKWYISDIRTYGYPLFLAVAFKFAELVHVGDNTGVFLLQWPLYVGSAWLAATSLLRGRRRLLAFLLLAANPLLVVYTAQAFTEAVSLACILFATAALARVRRSDRWSPRVTWLVAGALASGYSMAVRPGNLLVPVCYALATVLVLLVPTPTGRWIRSMIVGVLTAAAVVAPLVPQVLINHRHYGTNSPLPVFDLSRFQTSVGLEMLRYATNVSTTCGEAALVFTNPDEPDLTMSTPEALRYYSLDWPGGPRAVVLHVFSGLDPRPFLVDQHDFGTRYERWLQAFTVALLIVAVIGIVRFWRAMRLHGWRNRPDVLFLGAVALLATGLLATSAAEYRFGAIPLIAISLLAALGVPRRLQLRPTLVAVGAGVALMLAWVAVSDWVLATSTVWQQCAS